MMNADGDDGDGVDGGEFWHNVTYTRLDVFFSRAVCSRADTWATVKMRKKGAFARPRLYTPKLLHREVFTQRSFYTQKLLHIETFYPELLHRGAFAHKYVCTQTLLIS
jgi:hypothetical protein